MISQEFTALMPFIILITGILLVLLAGAVKPGFYTYRIAIAATSAALLCNLVLPVDSIIPGISITRFSRFFSSFFYAAGILGLLLASDYSRRRNITGEEFPATILFALVGMGAACAATDLLMLFLGLESFTFAFYILVAIERKSLRGGEAGLKYFLNGTLSAALIAMGMALIYCSAGSITLADLVTVDRGADLLFQGGFCLILLGIAFKLSLAPAHLWTADVYQGATAPVTALLSTASKLATVAGLILLLPMASGLKVLDIMSFLSVASMILGTLSALVQTNLKRMLAWSSVGQMGYVALAFVVSGSGGLRGAVFYAIVYAFAGLAAFGSVSVMTGEGEPEELNDLRGMAYKTRLGAAALALAMFSLAGLPPTAGFIGKVGIFTAALRGAETILALVGIITSIISLFFYLRIIALLYDNSAGVDSTSTLQLQFSEKLALLVCMTGLIFLGLFPAPLLDAIAHLL